MYLRHYDNDQNGPTFREGGGIGVYETAELKKNTFETATKIRLKPKIASKNRLNRFFTS